MPRSEGASLRSGSSGAIAPGPYDYLRQLMRERTGIVLEPGKEYFVEVRLAALADEHGFGTVQRLLDGLQIEEPWGILHRTVAESLAVTETSFFRDLHPFEEMRDTILPRIIEARRATRAIHIWCTSVATGQEPYSVAMLLQEHFPELADWRMRLIASDFSHAMLRRAREGLYTQIEVNRGLPAPYLLRYFAKEGLDWRIRADLRNRVEFRQVNLVEPWPVLPPLDLVLMRNVLIYFSADTRHRVLRNLAEVMNPDGVLFLGSTETTMPADAAFEPVAFRDTVVHRPRPARAA